MKIFKIAATSTKLVTMALAIIAANTFTQQAKAQLVGFHTAYFQNQYLANPAMAGMEKGLNVNLGYQRQWNNIPGGPRLQNLTADYNSGNKIGLGLTVNGDQAGLISRTRVMGTYAYHLPLNSAGDKLSFGLSFGFNNSYVDNSKIVGDQGDFQAQNFNRQSIYADGDLGVAYTSTGLTLQAALPNLKNVFFGENSQNLEVDRTTFYTAASYKFFFDKQSNGLTLEPKLAFSGIKGFDNILDAGANFNLTTYHVNISGMYHTNKSATFGFGFDLSTIGLLLAYTKNTGELDAYANNTFELGIKLKLLR